MKSAKFSLKYVVLIMVSVAFFSCSKGDAGPAGPIGPAGVIGPAGPAGQDGADGVNGGADGQDGADGNANVMTSPWITVNFPGTAQQFVNFSVDDPIFNEFTVSSAAIYAYGRFVGGDGTVNVNSIPYTRGVRSYFFRMLPASNKIIFIGNTVDNSNVVFDELEKVRYVVIPVTISGKNSGGSTLSQIMAAGVDMNNYDEVANYFGWNN